MSDASDGLSSPALADAAPATLTWRDGAGEHAAAWVAPGAPPPSRLGAADDRTRAAEAVARASRGEALVYRGDYHNARQLLAAMSRRLAPRPPRSRDPAALFRAERAAVRREREVLGRLLVPLGAGWAVTLARAPDVRVACEEALGAPPEGAALLPLRDLLGIVGAHEWRRRGVPVPALGGECIHPHYGVYAPIRGEYVELVARAAAEWPVAGKRVLEVGTGTGVLAVVLARAGARVTATDLDPRAVACARENARRLGVADRVEVVAADLFPATAPVDLVVSNPPWVPAEAHGPLERAVYDPGGAFLERLVLGIPARLAPGGEAWIVLSDLAERLGLRAPDHLERLAARAGLRVAAIREAHPAHPRARDRADPLHDVRSREVTRLFRLVAAGG
ncbi:N5-glutamine methyltransferase family protein [Anaeromyxobacter oryzisoli]|uniref:N5-glutamine methyltransferase family protein n=1 Tax=Anaeromyxobacter oryzisoli TaxID=2925408 RepID=UPI001F589A30|nr:class I SAM-dependent methyltransferase [Anaeromyxobacter sp. SG63]